MDFLKRIANDIKQNYLYLIFAFVIAVAAWLVVSINVFPTIENKVNGIIVETPLTEYMIQHNLQIVNSPTDAVDIRIEGKRFDISGLKAEDFSAAVNLSQIRAAGTYTVPVSVAPKNDVECSILETDPLSITLVIDEIISRDFNIKGTAPNISLSEGYYIDEITASPDVITITGSASVIDKITSVEARSTFKGEITESHETVSDLIIYGANGAKIINDDLKLSTEIVSVNIPVYKQKELPLKFSITNYPVNFDKNSLKYTIYPETITVAAPDDSIDNLSELEIAAIDITDIKLNQTTSIPITLPEGYKNLSGNPTARITWDIEEYGKLDYTIDNIALSNVPDNFDVSLITNAITITAIGPSERLAELSPSDFYVTANLLGVSLREGTQDVAVNIIISGANQKCWVSGKYKATIDAQPIISETEE